MLHCSLLAGGIFFISWRSLGPETSPSLPRPVTVISRPVAVKKDVQDTPKLQGQAVSAKPLPNTEGGVTTRKNTPHREAQRVGTDVAPPQGKSVKIAVPTSDYPTAPTRTTGTGTRASKPSPKPSVSPSPDTRSVWGVSPTPSRGAPSSGPGENPGGENLVTRRAFPLSRPEFNLNKRFPELKTVSVKAEFKIKEDGKFEPTLLTTTGNPTADVVILGKLLEYKWAPALEKGKPVEDNRVLDIDLSE